MVRRHRRSVLPALLLALLIALAASPSAMAYIYWGHQASKTGVGRATLDGTKVDQPFVPSVAGNYAWVGAVAADASYLYWGNNNPNSTTGFAAPVFARANSDGTGVNQAFTASIGQAITGATAAGGYLYWTFNNQDTSGVGRTPIIGGQQYQAMESTFGEPNPHTCGVAVDDKYIYFANGTTYSIGRAEIANFGTLQQVIDGEFIELPVGTKPCGVAVDAAHIYWGVNDVNNAPGTAIGRAAKDGTDVSFGFWGGAYRVTGVAVDDDFVYWSNLGTGVPGTGSIGRGTKATGGADPSFVGGLDAPWGVAVDPKGTAPAPPTPVPSQLPPPPNPLSVGVNSGPSGGGSSSIAVPCSNPAGCQGPRPDFSRVWVTKTSFVPATWSTPLIVGKSAGAGGAAAARSGGTVFNYILDRAAVAKIAIQRREPGRRVGRSCRTPSRNLARRPACARYRTVVTLRRAAIKGTNALPFSGRIKGKALKAGSYRAVFSATAAGATGAADKAVAFRILAP